MWRAKRPTLLLYELSWQEELTSTHTPTYVQVPVANLCPSLPSVTRVAAALCRMAAAPSSALWLAFGMERLQSSAAAF